jgi:hypothetical protein
MINNKQIFAGKTLVYLSLFASSYSFDLARGSLVFPIIFDFFLLITILANLRLNKNFLIIVALFTIFFTINSIYFNSLRFGFFFRILSLIMGSYFIIKVTGRQYLIYLIEAVYKLSVIGLVFFLLQNIAFNFTYESVRLVDDFLGLSTTKGDGDYYATIIVYTINTTDFHRNCGFMFEAGAYATFLSVVISIYLVLSNFHLKSKYFYVLFISILTTFSTTGYICLYLVIILILYNKNIKNKAFLLFITVPFVISVIIFSFIKIPFLNDKILRIYYNTDNQLYYGKTFQGEGRISIGRSAGLVLDMEDFISSPFLGYGGNTTEKPSWVNTGADSINGLGTHLVTFGIFGFILTLYLMYLFYHRLTKENAAKGELILFLIFLIVTFSFDLIQTLFFFTFQLFYLTVNDKNQKPLMKSDSLAGKVI